MSTKVQVVIVTVCMAVAAIWSAPSFVKTPSLSQVNDSAVISFSVNEPIDVEVAIVNSNGKIVRHLAAGVLGGAYPPPAPLTAGLSQSVKWDYNDDNGNHVPWGETYKARVRLGVKPVWQYFINTAPLPGLEYPTPDIPSKTQSVMRMSHPLFGKIQLEQNAKLYLTVNDNDEKVYIRTFNTADGWKLAYHVFDGRTGKLIDTIFRNEGERHQHHINGEIAFSWDGDVIYSSSGLDCMYRFTTERMTLWPVTNKGGVCDIITEHGNTRGHAVGPDEHIYNIYEPPILAQTYFNNVQDKWQAGRVAKIDTTGTIVSPAFIEVHAPLSCVRVDPKGNVFVGARIKPKGKPVPDYVDTLISSVDTMWTDRWWATEMYGSILKFGPNGGRMTKDTGIVAANTLEAGKDLDTLNIKRYTLTAEGLEWSYYGFSPALSHYGHIRATADGGVDHPNPRMARLGSRCLCQVGRFDVDRFGRVFLPDPYKLSFTAIDNNRNLMFSYGHKDMWNKYDSLIRKSVVKLMSWPHSIEATDEALYIADQFNNQVVRFRLDADVAEELSIPVQTEKMLLVRSFPAIESAPNPFGPSTIISYYVPESGRNVNVSIFDSNGRLVKTLVNGKHNTGGYKVAWDIKNLDTRIGNGIYVCRYTYAGGVKTVRMAVLR
ncbi:MAG: T9SS type A sorting domain-containing protein [Fibrobacteres bacterium]|nr:T9SS type A sorting domain-containing protein [Fibrobacterota bacterium]